MSFRSPARPLLVLAAASAVATGVLAAPAQAHTETNPHGPSLSLTRAQDHVIHEATERLRTPEAAIAAGYLPTDACTELPGTGGMGYHYVNPTLAGDGRIDPRHPDILVFVPGPNGRRVLGAAEFFQPDADQDIATTGDRPSLFGHPFDGPMLGHEPGMPIHYDLHVWLYKKNPSGELAPWNPRVTCPAVN
jgi:hypothetical protein